LILQSEIFNGDLLFNCIKADEKCFLELKVSPMSKDLYKTTESKDASSRKFSN
jgi:hypothetical protein